MRLPRRLALVVCALALLAPVRGQGDAPPPPGTSRERVVTAEGRAAIDPNRGGVEAAKEAARQAALRAAVEKALGVYVSAQTLTRNYQLVSDRIVARADGFAVPETVLSEEVGAQTVRVVLRARVSVRPLAEQIRALGLARAWRVRVAAEPEGVSAGGAASLEKALGDAGFTVVADAEEADVTVRLSPRLTTVAARDLETAAGPVTLYTMRAEVVVRAVRAGSGRVEASLSSVQTALHIRAETAQAQAVKAGCEALSGSLVDAMLVLPASLSQPVRVRVAGLSGLDAVERLEQSLEALGGVGAVTRRGWGGGSAEWEVEALAEALPTLPRDLERIGTLAPRRLRVIGETKGGIDARLETPPAPPTRPRAAKKPVKRGR